MLVYLVGVPVPLVVSICDRAMSAVSGRTPGGVSNRWLASRPAIIAGMQVLDAAGRPLNATFSAEPEGDWVALIMESRSGRAAGRPGRNADYNPALTLLLERLARLDATLVDALVDSRKTQALGIPEVERRLITEPVRLCAGAGHGSASCTDGNGAGQDRPGAGRDEGR